MQNVNPFALPLVVGLGAAGLGAGSLTFDPSPGTAATRTFEERSELSLVEASLTVAGAEDEDVANMSIDLVQSHAIEVTDTYGESADGRPRSLRRTYDAVTTGIELDLVDGDGDTEVATCDGSHPLAGHAVRFEWDDDEGASVPRFADGDDGQAAWLDGLAIDMDLASFLVDEDGGLADAQGARWTVDPKSVLDLTRPGGIVAVPFEITSGAGETGLFFTALLSCRDVLDEPEGEVELLWKTTRDVDGTQCAVCDLEIAVRGSTDLAERLFDQVAGVLPEAAEAVEILSTASVAIALEGEGELLWNLDEQRLHAVELELDNRTRLEASGSKGDAEAELVLAFEGTTKLTVRP